ncbi:hypothetical protein [Nocardia sp. NPDC049149]|uniref:hypothetical protein n=1 Tax=Nocardia sp. NPDC049149 TaxID=3364315 RepID=UPI003723626F
MGSQPVDELADQILEHLDNPAPLLDLFADLDAVRVADDLVHELRSRRMPREKLRSTARFVAENATRREVAKLGIVLLGISGDERDCELLQLLGTLDEFALFAVVALMNTQPDRHRAVFQLAQRLDGWGRIHAVERLAGCTDPDIKAWLLRTGFRNGVMNEYLAHLAATTGGLYEALLDEVDDALLSGAAGILTALAMGGPANDMHDYDDAVPAMHRFAELVDAAAPDLGLLDAALTLDRFVHTEELDWPDGEPVRLRERYRSLVSQTRWRELVTSELAARVSIDARAANERRFESALSCAGRLRLHAFPYALERLRIDPYNGYVWQWAIRHCDGPFDEIVDLAEELLPLDDLASGPSESVGLGIGFEADMALELVVQALHDHPGLGERLVRVALANRVIRCRWSALKLLRNWPTDPAAVRDWVATAADREPNPDLRTAMLAFPDSGAEPVT